MRNCMKNHPLMALIVSIILIIFYHSSLASDQPDIITELSRRSHLPVDEIKELLTHCNASDITQLNLNLCADRNATIAQFKLKQTLFNKKFKLPACKSMLDKKMTQWEDLRNKACENATEVYSGGSIRPFIQTSCIANETTKMIKKLGDINNCSQLNGIIEPIRIKLNALPSD